MANVSITHKWDDGAETTIDVYVEGDYPDAVPEAVASALRMWRETVASE